ncbi:hypothetical protein [Nocardiopsis baichengensis]|uniref:hypothetical protein n=1 Tax=Nocardiopsis baichengensis TaxID=280240 RepID=UPI001267F72E|nr:hypothetical protein [Nocardiopsis baichengensis]
MLTDEAATLAALTSFIDATVECYIAHTSLPFDYSKGKSIPNPNFIMTKTDWDDRGDSTIHQLRKARNVTLLGRFSDNGLVRVNFTARNWEYVNRSELSVKAVSDLTSDLRSAARSRLTGSGMAALVGFFPILTYFAIGFADYFAAYILDPQFREQVSQRTDPAESNVFIYIPAEKIIPLTLFPWPVFIIASLGILSLRFFSGGLRTWPQQLNSTLLHYTLYNLRTTFIPKVTEGLGNKLLFAAIGAALIYITTGNVEVPW